MMISSINKILKKLFNNMYNEKISKKITSLTLMAIMVAGGLTFAVPGMMPEVVAENQTLFVSAYYPGNAYKEYYFGGAAVVEVVVRDPMISDTTEGASGMPRVEVNGDKLAMVQGSDGSWYAYIADTAKVTNADGLGTDYGLEYGTTCTASQAVTATGIDDSSIFDDVSAVWVSQEDCALAGTNIANSTGILKSPQAMNTAPDAGGATPAGYGNVGIATSSTAWPFIQVYNFDDVSAELEYFKSSGSETQYIKYSSGKDSAHYASTDRTEYPPGAQVHIELMAPGLNLDPTSVDNWSFDIGSETDANSTTACYYDKFTSASSAASRTAIDTSSDGLKLKDTCTLLITFGGSTETILDIQDNDDSTLVADQLTFLETAPSTGIFTNMDDDQDASLFVLTTAKRNTAATINYDDEPFSIVVKNFTGSVDFDESAVGDEWNSGEVLPIIHTDQDYNLNSEDDEDFKFSEEDTVYPTIHVGDPLILTGTVKVELGGGTSVTATVDGSSGVANIGSSAAQGGDLDDGGTDTSGLVIDTGISVNDFRNMLEALDSDADSELSDEDTNAHSTAANGTQHRGAVLMYWDVSGLFVNTPSDVDIVIQDQDGGGALAIQSGKATSGNLDITELFTGSGTADISDFDDDTVFVNFYQDVPLGDLTAKAAFYIDFFSFHSNGINNAVYRCQCEETSDSSGVYEGEVEYYMINQNEGDAYADWPDRTHLSDELVMIMTGDLTGVDAPRVQVSDTDGDGVSTPQADQQDALTHSGTASLDADAYKIADTVTVTITDMDLNTDSELIEIYKVDDDGGTDGTGSADRVADTDDHFVEAGAGFSYIMDITFDDTQWIDSSAAGITGASCTDDALDASGFTLVETALDSGVFTGTFQVPSTYCSSSTASSSTTGTDMEVNYIDFYDASSNTIEVGAGAAIYANTGSIELHREVYPVPFNPKLSSGNYAFLDNAGGKLTSHTTMMDGMVMVMLWVYDDDFDQSPHGEDNIATTAGNSTVTLDSGDTACTECGPVVVKIYRGADYHILRTGGNDTPGSNTLNVDADGTAGAVTEVGPLKEIEPDAGIFEMEFMIGHNKGPSVDGTQQVINQGDVLTVEYTDPQTQLVKTHT